MKPSRSPNLSPLGKWLWEQRISDREFAVMMAAELGVSRFSTSTVENWRYGRRNPYGENMRAIKALTGITADQMLGDAA